MITRAGRPGTPADDLEHFSGFHRIRGQDLLSFFLPPLRHALPAFGGRRQTTGMISCGCGQCMNEREALARVKGLLEHTSCMAYADGGGGVHTSEFISRSPISHADGLPAAGYLCTPISYALTCLQPNRRGPKDGMGPWANLAFFFFFLFFSFLSFLQRHQNPCSTFRSGFLPLICLLACLLVSA